MDTITMNILPEDFATLPIYFYTACGKYEQETMCRPAGTQDFHQILIVIGGKGILKHDGKTYYLKKGSAFFTAQGVPSKYINTDGLITAFLTVKGNGMEQILKHFNCGDFLFFESVNTEKYTADINNIIKEYYKHKRESVLSALTYSFYIDFFEQLNENSLELLDKTMLYIEKNFAQKLTLSKLAEINQSSVSKLCHDFKNKYGCTVFQYILNLRLTYAYNLLVNKSNVKTQDVASICGFDDVSYFCRAYKNKFGISPSKT